MIAHLTASLLPQRRELRPYLSAFGADVHCQWWGRDTSATGSFLTDGLNYTVGL